MAKKEMDLTPTPAGYKRMLEFIVENNTEAEHREWARKELKRIQPDGVLVKEWSEGTTHCECTEDCTEDSCPCMDIPCEDEEHMCEEPRGCLEECQCAANIQGGCDT